MSTTRIWIFGMVAAMLVIVIAGWTLGISPILTQVTAANSQTATIQTSNTATQTQLASLRVQFAGIDKLRSKLAALRLSVPEAQAASDFITEVTDLAATEGVTVKSVSIANATLYVSPDAAAAVAPAAGTSTATPTATPAPTTPAPATMPTPTGGLVLVPIVVSVSGSFDADKAFVGALQEGSRLIVMSTLGMSTDSGSGGVMAVVNGDIFTQQGTSDVVSNVKAPTSTSTVTPTATATPTPTPTPTATKAATKTGTTGGTTTATGTNPAPTDTPTPTDTAPSP